MATWSSMVTVTLWLTIASGGNFLSSGMSSPAAWADEPARVNTAKSGKAYRIAHLRGPDGVGPNDPDYRTAGRRFAIGRKAACYSGVTAGKRRGPRVGPWAGAGAGRGVPLSHWCDG